MCGRIMVFTETNAIFNMLGHGTAPGGLIEGIADFVRLRAGFAPPHWDPKSGKRWDEGYAVTGFFGLD